MPPPVFSDSSAPDRSGVQLNPVSEIVYLDLASTRILDPLALQAIVGSFKHNLANIDEILSAQGILCIGIERTARVHPQAPAR